VYCAVLSTKDKGAMMTAIGRGLPAQHARLDTADSGQYVRGDDQAGAQRASTCQHWDGNSHDQALLARTKVVS